MANFKVGQRVRINREGSTMHRREATVTGIIRCEGRPIVMGTRLVHKSFTGTRYRVAIDGHGPISAYGNPYSYEAHQLEPLTGADPANLWLEAKPVEHMWCAIENAEGHSE